jgi:hypothetical protein
MTELQRWLAQLIDALEKLQGDKVPAPQHRQRRAVVAKTEASTGAEPSAELEVCWQYLNL